MKHKKSCYVELFKELSLFEQFAGLKVNYDKTEVMRIGSLKDSKAQFYSDFSLHWSEGPVTILGILVDPDAVKMAKVNYEQLLTKIETVTKIWSKRSLTLLGRILIVNTLIIPTLTYRLQVLKSPTKEILVKYRKTVQEFLWQGKRAKIAYNKLCQSYEQGGLKLIDLELKNYAMKAKWMQVDKLQDSLLSEVLSKIIPLKKEHRQTCNINVKDVKKMSHDSIFTDILVAWPKVNFCNPTSAGQVKKQTIWNNTLIKR